VTRRFPKSPFPHLHGCSRRRKSHFHSLTRLPTNAQSNSTLSRVCFFPQSPIPHLHVSIFCRTVRFFALRPFSNSAKSISSPSRSNSSSTPAEIMFFRALRRLHGRFLRLDFACITAALKYTTIFARMGNVYHSFLDSYRKKAECSAKSSSTLRRNVGGGEEPQFPPTVFAKRPRFTPLSLGLRILDCLLPLDANVLKNNALVIAGPSSLREVCRCPATGDEAI
jgi:hypothetical protein